MSTTLTIKGQVTIPKDVRDAAGFKPGDKIEARNAASGVVILKKASPASDYRKRIEEVAARRLIRDGMTTDEFMEFIRGEVPIPPKDSD